MTDVLAASLVGAIVVLLAAVMARLRLRRLARERLANAGGRADEAPPPPRARRFLRRYRAAPWLAGAVLALGLHYLVGLHWVFAGSFGLMLGLLGGQLEAAVAVWRSQRIEAQLGEAIDLMVAALRAGAGVLSALEGAVREARSPLRPQLEEVLGRIRYGDAPESVLRGLVERVPLEAFRLFTAALAVHWEVGGSLAPTLATVGRTIRDRIDVGRRIRSLTTQARASIVAVMGITGFIALVMWRTDPDRMAKFLGTEMGRGFLAVCLLLQALGIVWSAAISRVKY